MAHMSWPMMWAHTGWKQPTPGAHSKPRKKVYSDIMSNHLSQKIWTDWSMREANHNKNVLFELKYLELTSHHLFIRRKRRGDSQKGVPSFWSLTTTITRLQKKNPGSLESPKHAGENNSMFPMVSSDHQHSTIVSKLSKEVAQL